jgi:putative phosphoserine phosphatase/1-acylglycerol-3-phosphate O-acyltransferase
VFVDRADHEQALRALQPAVDTLRSGLSLAIAPEGTRSAGREMGRLKKGAFHMALAGGVPIVPIIIENAGDVLPRHGWLMTAARVRVVVCAPLETLDWTLDEIDAQIARVEQLFRQTLARADAPPSAR